MQLNVTDLGAWYREFGARILEDGDSIPLERCIRCGLGCERDQDMGGYFNHELKGLADEPPRMGRYCEKCKVRIPHFLDLPPVVESRARGRARGTAKPTAIAEIRAATGCPESWAKIWVMHLDGPHIDQLYEGPPCPYCKKPLRTKVARQCVECGMDWHDPVNVKRNA
jgi:hypothetical protein